MTEARRSESDPPFAGLTPDALLDAVEAAGYRCDGRLLALNSYENRVWQVGMDEGPPKVVKFYRPGRWSDAAILEEHAFTAALAEREIPVVPPETLAGGATLFHHGGFRLAVFPRRGGRSPELGDPAVLEWIGRFLGRIHALGATRPFRARPTLDIAGFGEGARDFLLASDFIPFELREAWSSVSAQALDGVRRAFARVGVYPQLRLHGDCHAGNILWTDDGPHFVDFDDARNGPAVQDLWMLLSGSPEEMALQLGAVLRGYRQFADFDPIQLHLVEALRTLRILHHAAWLARRWKDPAFPAAFPWFDSPRYWQDHILTLREQIPAMDEAPLQVL